jgi:hypothetical protein
MGQLKRYEILDDIGFIGDPSRKYTTEDAKLTSAFIQALKIKRLEKDLTQKEVELFANEFNHAYRNK